MPSAHRIAGPADPGTRVLLVGMMGAGKTTVGRALADATGWPYLDNDELVLRATGRPTAEVLSTGGEGALRRVEAAALAEALAAPPPLVAGVAAGVIEDPRSRRLLRRGAFVVHLRAPVAVLADRVGSGEGRPWLDGDPTAALQRLHRGRDDLYRGVADLVLDVEGRSPHDLATDVLSALPPGHPGPG